MEGSGLPGNIIRCILDGFAFADSAKFKDLCVTLGTLERAPSIHAGRPETSLKQKCFSMLRDLEICFTDLSAVHQWDGVGHVGATYFTGFDEGSTDAMVAWRQMPFDDWVKKVKCNNCDVLGHIKIDCPKLAKDQSGGDQRNQDNHQSSSQNFQCDNQRSSDC